MSEEFTVTVRGAVERGAPLEELVSILQMWRDQGLASEDALSALALLRDGADEQFEDRVLELMDIASGFCRPEMRVWDS